MAGNTSEAADTNTNNPSPTSQQQQQPPVTDKAVNAFSKIISDFRSTSAIAGRSKEPFFQKFFFVDKNERTLIWKSLKTAIYWEDMVILAAMAYLTVPFAVQLPFSLFSSTSSSKYDYKQTFLYIIADHIQQITKIALSIYIVDIIKLICMGMGIESCNVSKFPNVFAQTAYTMYVSNRIAAIKRYVIRQYISDHPETFGRMQILNRLADAIIYGLTVFIILNVLQVQMGVAVQSILAFGSVGTLAMGLASQGIAKQVFNGLMLASSDRIYEGDDVQFGNGIQGNIVHLGWMETVLRGSDEVLVSVPNTDLVNQRIANLSRVRLSQVKQILQIRYDDAEKIPVLIDRIKHEIKMSCPDLITDGTRPFRVYWTNMNDDHCEITIDTRHRVKPTGDVYLTTRQNVIMAIHRALKRHNCKLVERPFIQAK